MSSPQTAPPAATATRRTTATMRRSRSPSPSYRAFTHHKAAKASDSLSLIRSFNVETNPARPVRPSPLTASAIRDMPLDLVDRIRSFPLFVSAPEEFLVAIGNHLRPQVHGPQDHILREGDDAKAMYWLVRGVVAVTSRDGEAVYAELKPGAFFGEIGVLMDVPRTATIIARTKCLVVVLKKEDLQAELPRFPDMEQAIRQEAEERLTILRKKRKENGGPGSGLIGPGARQPVPGEVAMGEKGAIKDGGIINAKKRKSPGVGVNVIEDPAAGSALGSGLVNVRKTLRELPLFSTLPADVLHFLGLSAQPKTYAPFTDIVSQGNPGHDIFFIVRGEAEVIREPGGEGGEAHRTFYQRPRLRQGQYFGEVASLGLSPGRTATVRAITTVECLMIGGEALDELWRRCPRNIKQQVEETARSRYDKAAGATEDADTEMTDADDPERRQSLPHVTFSTPNPPSTTPSVQENMEPIDPDPFLSVDMENIRNRRRSSLAPPNTPTMPAVQPEGGGSPTPVANGARSPRSEAASPVRFSAPFAGSPTDVEASVKRARLLLQSPRSSSSHRGEPRLPDRVLVQVFEGLGVAELMRLRRVCTHWRELLAVSETLCKTVDLAPYAKRVTDKVLTTSIAPFIASRARSVDISHCSHITDEGFSALWRACGRGVRSWKMSSVWDVSANQILEMSEHMKGLEEVDWSNCRKVGDNLLARVVGWVVPEQPPSKGPEAPAQNPNKSHAQARAQAQGQGKRPRPAAVMPPPGTVMGCPSLAALNLSYCKNMTDRSMAHLAAHAHTRLRSLCLTRCSSITDAGFQTWAPFHFPLLTSLCLADLTYLTDGAVVSLVNAAKNLERLDLSFCCALTDTSTEVVALGLPRLKELRLAFCGSAVSDGSLGCVALHLSALEGLSVRGCVRVTGAGMESVLEGCAALEWVDGSRCINLLPWVRGGGVARWGYDERAPRTSPGIVGGGGGGGGGVFGAGEGGEGKRGGGRHALRPLGRGFGRRRARRPVRFILQKSEGLR